MRVVITGGAGFIGRRLALRLLELEIALTDAAGREQPVERVLLFDRAAPDPRLLHDPRVEAVIGDIRATRSRCAPQLRRTRARCSIWRLW